MRCFTLTFFCILIYSLSVGQDSLRQSLINAMAEAKSDTLRVIAYYQYGDLVGANSKDSARFYYEKGKQLARHYNNDFALAIAHGYEIPWLNEEGRFAEALKICEEALILFEKVKAPAKDLAVIQINLGNEWQYLGNFKKAADHYFAAQRYAVEAKNLVQQALILSNLASLYSEMGDKDNNIKYSLESKKIAEAIPDDYRMFSASYNLAEAYLDKKMMTEGKSEIDYAIAVVKRMPDSADYAIDVLMLKADYALKSQHTQEAAVLLRQILELCQTQDYKEYELIANKELARIEAQAGNYSNARSLIQKAMQLAETTNSLKHEAEALIIYSDLEFESGNAVAALQLRKQYERINDSLAISESHKNAQLLEINFETEKSQLRISELTKETQIQQLKNRQRTWVIAGLLFSIACLLALAFGQYKNQQNKQQLALQQKALQEQEIEQLQTEKQLALAEERLRIAGDMHDDVGAGLSRIRYITNSLTNSNEISNDTIRKIVSLSDESVEKMNEIIWALNQGNQKLDDLIYYIRSQVAEMVHNAGIDFVCELPDHIPDITFSWKENRNTYLLVKEAVNNAVKHSQASLIAVDIVINGALNISIVDNGIGFNTDSENHDGNGLLNYKKRILALNGHLNIDSVSGQGTTVAFNIPI